MVVELLFLLLLLLFVDITPVMFPVTGFSSVAVVAVVAVALAIAEIIHMHAWLVGWSVPKQQIR